MKITNGLTLAAIVASMATTTVSVAQDGGKGIKQKDGFTLMPSGLEYKIVKHGDGKRKAANTDHAELFIHVYLEDSVIFDSRKMYNETKPVPVTIANPKANGDLMEGFMMLVAGDSAIFHVPVDSMLKGGVQPMPGMKPGVSQKMRYEVQVVTVRSEEEEKKFAEAQAGKQKGIDEKLLTDYFKKKGIKATKTASGLYYTISKKGTGPLATAGQVLSVNYTGTLLNGKAFDSNVDTSFKHPEPFKVPIGKGNVIKGWDEGFLLFNKGTKAVLYIPSTLAYGSQDRSPQIPANSILIFEVELLDIEDAPAAPVQVDPAQQAIVDDKLLQDYFAKNGIKATKTPSGLYYAISQKGLGPNAAPGKKVTMNYTGKTMDGKVFDSNTDPKFNHVSPFSFTLGVGQVIKGWDEGVQLLQLGSRGSFYIPSGLGYGPSGTGGAIPPNAVLIFDVEVVGID
jgi:FKBP-type peptidyl-prolyl cis-trans isomerase FkpA